MQRCESVLSCLGLALLSFVSVRLPAENYSEESFQALRWADRRSLRVHGYSRIRAGMGRWRDHALALGVIRAPQPPPRAQQHCEYLRFDPPSLLGARPARWRALWPMNRLANITCALFFAATREAA